MREKGGKRGRRKGEKGERNEGKGGVVGRKGIERDGKGGGRSEKGREGEKWLYGGQKGWRRKEGEENGKKREESYPLYPTGAPLYMAKSIKFCLS